MSDGEEIELTHTQRVPNTDSGNITSLEEPVTLRRFTLQLLQDYLEKYDYDVLKVAQVLNVGKSTLYRLIKNKELNVPKKLIKCINSSISCTILNNYMTCPD